MNKQNKRIIIETCLDFDYDSIEELEQSVKVWRGNAAIIAKEHDITEYTIKFEHEINYENSDDISVLLVYIESDADYKERVDKEKKLIEKNKQERIKSFW